METTSKLQRIHLLPEEVQKQVSDFIEFLMSKRKKSQVRQPVFGSAKGRIHMSADFDEPLDDFKDYM